MHNYDMCIHDMCNYTYHSGDMHNLAFTEIAIDEKPCKYLKIYVYVYIYVHIYVYVCVYEELYSKRH